MDAVKYCKEKRRMLNSLGRIGGVCFGVKCNKCCFMTEKGCVVHEKESVEIVEKWSAEHPQKTILQDFLEKYPNATLCRDVPNYCPMHLGYLKKCEENCIECWNSPLEG